MKRIAVFPGSFDPITKGHEAIVQRGLSLFDEIVVAIGTNSSKQSFFDINQRIQLVQQTFERFPAVKVRSYHGLTVDFCREVNAGYILRGLRSNSDFEYESTIAQMNAALHPQVETVFLLTSPELSAISSTVVRDILRHKGNAAPFLPAGVKF